MGAEMAMERSVRENRKGQSWRIHNPGPLAALGKQNTGWRRERENKITQKTKDWEI